MQRILLRAQNISDNHPAVELLHDLETTAYYVDKNLSGYSNRMLVRFIIQASSILKWTNTMLNYRLKVPQWVPYVLWFHFPDTTS